MREERNVVIRKSAEEIDHPGDVREDLDPGADHFRDLAKIKTVPESFSQIGLCHPVELVRIHSLEVFAVHPAKLLVVKNRRRFVDPVIVEDLHEFFEAEDLPVAVGGPSQKCDEVDDCLGKESLLDR